MKNKICHMNSNIGNIKQKYHDEIHRANRKIANKVQLERNRNSNQKIRKVDGIVYSIKEIAKKI